MGDEGWFTGNHITQPSHAIPFLSVLPSSTASQGRSNIPISFFPALGITPPGEDTKEGKDREGMGCDSELAV